MSMRHPRAKDLDSGMYCLVVVSVSIVNWYYYFLCVLVSLRVETGKISGDKLC
jgi:hypothetical protein